MDSIFSMCFSVLSLAFFIIAILTGVSCYLSVVLITLMVSGVEHLFHVPFGHLYFFFGKMSIQILCPFFSWIFWEIFAVKLYEVPYMFFILTLYQRLDLHGSSNGKESACNAEPRV